MADVSGFSRLMAANEDGTVDRIQAFQRAMRDCVEGFEGRVVDTAGDSVLAEFDSVVNAVECARRMQETGDAGLAARIGIHLGDVIVEDYRVYGDGVNIAARLESLADPGGLCISEAVWREVRGKLDLRVEELGLCELKNIEHPIRLYKVPPVRAVEVAKPESKAVAPAPREGGIALRDVTQPLTLVPACVAGFMIASEELLFPSAGALPALGTVLLAVVGGLVLEKRARGAFFLALGAALASAGAWTNWSHVTNVLFLLAGVIVAALGLGRATRRERG
jgi:hypothetical protein